DGVCPVLQLKLQELGKGPVVYAFVGKGRDDGHAGAGKHWLFHKSTSPSGFASSIHDYFMPYNTFMCYIALQNLLYFSAQSGERGAAKRKGRARRADRPVRHRNSPG